MNPDRLDHLDADVIAAWFDGTLDSGTRAAAEAHAADCARCQAVLAAMVRTDGVTAQPKPAWFRAPFRWALPLATATAALAIWVAVDQRPPAPAPPPAPDVATRTVPAPDAAQSGFADRASSASPAPVAGASAVPDSLKAREEQTKPVPRRKVVADQPSARNEAEQSAAKPAGLAETVETRRQELARDAGASPASQPRPAASPVPPLPPASPAPQAVGGVQQQQPPPPPSQQRADSRLRAVAFAAKEIASPDLSVRWRIGPGATIERSPDGGRTWVAQPSGVTGELVAASAPSADVCWIVGRAGIVLLSTDGATWRRRPFPEATDLRAVTAADARIASVTAADGRVFRTTDGGVTWTREDPKQRE